MLINNVKGIDYIFKERRAEYHELISGVFQNDLRTI